MQKCKKHPITLPEEAGLIMMLKSKHFATPAITSAKYVYMTHKISRDKITGRKL
jgi:hypothetical protein